MPTCRTSVTLTVDPDGLLALRCALAANQMSGAERVAWRTSHPARRPVTVARSDAPTVPSARSARTQTPPVTTPAPPSPRIPTPSAPAEPVAEQAELMAIVARAQAGEAEAFGELFDRYHQVVYRYVAYRCGNVTLAEDLTSETFLRALRRISSYTWQGRDFGAWLVTIARNLLADHFKSSRYRLELATSDLVAAGADRRQEGPEDEVLSGLTNAALIDAVKQLAGEQQECIVLRFLQGLSVAETAVALGKNEGAIKALQYRAVKSLGRLLPSELVR